MVRPEANETEFDFVVRAHKALVDEIPDPETRNKTVWELWGQYGEPDRCQAVADRTFEADKYVASLDHCYFAEHETPKKNGNKTELVKYSTEDLADIINHARKRILTRQAFPAISDGHTPDRQPDGSKPPQPGVLGYTANYRLGMIGYEDPVFAVFADERHMKDKTSRLKELPRRSVELLTNRRTGERYFDPIAALGAEAPRLAMPAKYSTTDDDVDIERYSFDAAPAYPSGGNTFVQGEDYSAGAAQDMYGHNPQPVDQSDEFIAKIIDAMMRTDAMKWVREQMEMERAFADASMQQEAAAAQAPPAMAQPAQPPASAPPEQSSVPAGGPSESETDLEPVPEGSGSDKERMSMSDNPETQVERFSVQDYEVLVEKYAALAESHTTLSKQHQGLVDQLHVLHRDRTDARREQKLTELASKYSIVDLEDELDRCLYSREADMSDDEFERHVADVEKYGARAEPKAARPIPMGELPQGQISAEKYQAVYEMARDIHTAELEKGNFPAWDDVVQKAQEALNGKGV